MTRTLYLVWLVALFGCENTVSAPLPGWENQSGESTGIPGVGIDEPDAPLIDVDLPDASLLASRARRLSPAQYAHAVHDLFDGRVPPGTIDVINVALGASGYSTDPDANPPNQAVVEQLYFAAEEVALQSVDHIAELLNCDVLDSEACVDRFVDRLVLRAYRRPLFDEELQHVRARFTEARQEGFSPEEAFAVLVQETLLSAPFLYVTEIGDRSLDDGRIELSHYEIATRLGLAYADSIPDEALLQAAADGRLKDPEELATHAERLLETYPERVPARFVGEWLHLDSTLQKDLPDFDADLAASMREEWERLLARAVRSDASLGESLLNPQTIPLNARLAEFYGVEGFEPGADGWNWMAMPDHLTGLFSRPYALASWAGV
ncbi:MAG: DUF1592 domain-containing protein, partial [Myxococcota bacterium]